jgi:mRNA interferase RelE/StbE
MAYESYELTVEKVVIVEGEGRKLFKLEFKPRAIKDLKDFPEQERRRIIGKIESLQSGLSTNVKKLTNFTPEYRLRVGDYRILFEIEEDRVIIYRVIHRKDAYRS